MNTKYVRRALFGLLGGVPAAVLVWLGVELTIQDGPSPLVTPLVVGGAVATISGWLAVFGVGAGNRNWLLAQTAILSAGVLIAVFLAVAVKSGLFMIPAIVAVG